MKLSDPLAGLLLMLLGGGVALYARTFPGVPGHGVGPGAFPVLIGVGLAACGVGLLGARKKEGSSPWFTPEDWIRRPRSVFNAGLVIASLVFYAVAVEAIGFLITAFVILTALFVAFGVRRRWIVPISLAVTFALHAAFYSVLRVPLPWGWLEAIAW